MSELQTVTRAAGGEADAVRIVAAFLRSASFETTRLGPADAAALAALGTRPCIYASEIPGRSVDDQLAVVRAIAASGCEPVPHIAVRNFVSENALADLLARMVESAGVRRVLVIGGDRAYPAGPFRAAIDLIESGLLQSQGISEIGLAGYPDGHPRLSPLDLERSLDAKLEAAEQTGLRAHIVSQFGFAAETIVAWLRRLRQSGIDQPVLVGLAGPTGLAALLRFARICGVRASAQGLSHNLGLAKSMLGTVTPDRVVRPLAAAWAAAELGAVVPHFYSFGGLAATVRWVGAAAAGRLEPDRAGGFAVLPPPVPN